MLCPNCRCFLLPILPPSTEVDRKFEAQMMLANPRTVKSDHLIAGWNNYPILLERDDELPRTK